jgi:hypothetical protein
MVEVGFEQNEENFHEMSHASLGGRKLCSRNCAPCTLCPSLILIFNEKIIQYSRNFALQVQNKCHGTKPMHPSLLRAFRRHQEHDLKHPNLVDLVTTKQNKTNKLLSCIVRLVWPAAVGPSVMLPRAQLFFSSKTWFFGIYLNFQGHKSL